MNIQKILRYILLCGIFLVPFIPLIVASDMFFPFITGKNFTFRILIELLFGAWIVLAYWDSTYRVKKSLILIALTAFVGIIALADFFGENPFKSFWSNYERMEGLVGLIHLFAYFIVATSVLNTEKLWGRFFNMSLGVSVIIGIYGLFQLGGVLNINQGGVRVDGTFGNAAYLAVYSLFHIFIAAFMVMKQKVKTLQGSIYGGVILLNLVMLYFTATRGAVLGLLGGVLLTTLLIALFEKDRPILKKSAIGILIGVVLFIGSFIAVKDATFISESPVLSRFASISLEERTTKSRFMVWDMAWQGFKEKPILGWGQENFNFVFNKYYNPGMYAQEPWFDRAHNVFFDWLIAGGILGILAYLSLFAVAIYLLWFRVENLSITSKSILTGLFAGYFFQNLFVFDNLTSYVMFFSMLGYIHSKSIDNKTWGFILVRIKQFTNNIFGDKTMGMIIAPIVIIAIIFSVYFFNYKAIATNNALLEALKPHPQEEGPLTNLEYFKKAIAYNSFGTQEAIEQLPKVTFSIYTAEGFGDDIKNAFFNFANEELKIQTERVPNDTRGNLLYASFLDRFKMYDEAIMYFEKALELSPNKQAIYFGLVGSYLNKIDYEKALEFARIAFELEPEFTSARQIYALVAIYKGDDKLAEELLVPVFGTTLIEDDRFVNAYANRGQYNKVMAIWKSRTEKDPNNMQYRLSLAASYVEIGQRQKAIKEIEEVIALDPAFKDQGQYYINEIRAGRNP